MKYINFYLILKIIYIFHFRIKIICSRTFNFINFNLSKNIYDINIRLNIINSFKNMDMEMTNKGIVNDFFNIPGVANGTLNYNPKGESAANFKTKLAHINHARWLSGKPPIDHVYCNKCKSKDAHFTTDCPHIVCYICKGSHNTRYCPMKKKCQFCGGTDHLTQMCKKEDAINFRLKQISFCAMCKKKGHTAKLCKTNFNYNYRFNYRNFYPNYFWKKNNQWNKFKNYFNNNFNFRKRNNSFNYFRRRYF